MVITNNASTIMHAPLPCTCVWEVKFDKGTRPDLNIWYISTYKRADTFCDKPVEVGQIHLSFCGYHVTRFFKSSCVNVLSTVSSSSEIINLLLTTIHFEPYICYLPSSNSKFVTHLHPFQTVNPHWFLQFYR